MKHLTGMGRVVGRRIYGSPFEFGPQFKLFIDANHKPVIRGSDNAIWSRIRLIPFNVSIPKPQQDKKLWLKLRAEAPGILARAAEGCLRWQREGLGNPTAVTKAGEEYREEMDLVAEFIADCCEQSEDAQDNSGRLYAAFRTWCEEQRETPMSNTAFGKRLGEKGFAKCRTAGARLRKGLKLTESVEDTAHKA